ncbi:hypothetical protein [Burkholderia cepacia]|uniref:DUF3563 domain-containing protein n=1 Tax=Burkholderia cepacia TaxID=292 RepID=A0ABM6P7V8_BURCE|nr:hypothetical protein [Burkholderia cepacia]AIO29446.1 hypothetical protein DM41_3883 [Burkholderia cepacia ATCC 25416]ALK21444.1 hypothetical protein APZ15_27245 [Burkholderia cepacia ATCC 25416]ASE98484.1 hypothetical protein CEQ23_34645 [Burkholderia cepacia]ATF83256.1 hypothetical protein CO711_39650 [Burkholderia cepacia]MCA8469328.1 hypothetical protein [Burkholderia cepacia]
MSIRNRTSRLAGALGVFVKRYGRKAQKHLAPNDRRYDRRYDRDVERAMRRMSPADLSDLLAGDDDTANDTRAGFADARRTP